MYSNCLVPLLASSFFLGNTVIYLIGKFGKSKLGMYGLNQPPFLSGNEPVHREKKVTSVLPAAISGHSPKEA